MKKPIAIILIMVALVVGAVIYGIVQKGIIQKDDDLQGRGSSGSSNKETIKLVGTGYAYNSGVASSTDKATIFQFSTSTDTTYVDTDTANFPQMYGNTSTAQFALDNADFLTFNVYFDPFIAASNLTLYLFGTNDVQGGSASSTIADQAEWYPLQNTATTTLSTGLVSQATTTMSITPGVATPVKYSFTLEKLNYNFLRLKVSNASTTDGSLLYIETRKF